MLNVKTFKEVVEVRKEIDSRMFNAEKYRMNFCCEWDGLGKTLSKENSKEVCRGGVSFRSEFYVRKRR
jgi:hypothetical protein